MAAPTHSKHVRPKVPGAPLPGAPAVHRIPRVRGANAYLVVRDSGLVLVDTGLPGNASRIIRFIQQTGYQTSDLRHILLTHGHPDHTGSVNTLREIAGARVLIHGDDCLQRGCFEATLSTGLRAVAAAVRDRRFSVPAPAGMAERGSRPRETPGRPRDSASTASVPPGWGRSTGAEHTVNCPGLPWLLTPRQWRIRVDGLLSDGDILDGLHVLHVPGHTPGSAAFYLEEQGVLFTGDLLTQRGRYISRSVPLPGTDLQRYHESLVRIGELPVTTACFGHGEPLTADAAPTLRAATDWYMGAPRWRRWLQMVPGPLRLGLQVGYRYR